MRRILYISLVAVLPFLHIKCSEFSRAGEDFVFLFNGKNLDGWVNVNCAPETWKVRDGMIVCSGIPTGVLRTEKQYENFIFEIEWMHLHEKGNAGLFIHSDDITATGQPFTRSIECQIMDGNHGDVFAIHGARMTRDNEDPFYRVGSMRSFPVQERANPAGEWNHYRVVSRDGILTLAVNGEIATRAYHVIPRKGYICLESEGSEVYFRNIKIKELPGYSFLAEQTARTDRGFVSLYNGLDLRGWEMKSEHEGWKADNWRLVNDQQVEDESESYLLSEKDYGDIKLIVDWRLAGEPIARIVPVIMPDGTQGENEYGENITVPIRYAGEAGILIRGSVKHIINITSWPEGSGGIVGYRKDNMFEPEIRKLTTPILNADNELGRWNRFEITAIGKKISVIENGMEVIREVTIYDLPERGQIGLQFKGAPVEFANIYIKEL